MRVLRHKKEEMLIDDNCCMRFTASENETDQYGNMEVINIIFVIWSFCSTEQRFVLWKELFFDLRYTEPRKVRVIGICSSKKVEREPSVKVSWNKCMYCQTKPKQKPSVKASWNSPGHCTAPAGCIASNTPVIGGFWLLCVWHLCADIVNMLMKNHSNRALYESFLKQPHAN